ncbi:MAG: NAD(P)-dependent oxidoreductase [Proteobacteria bacterium]|nr:NAD(P)-dependent oxidoreductase [Pseudomonadota bacterium]
MNLGYVGLGRMGGALVRRLLPHHTLRAYDLRPAVVASFATEGAVPAQNLATLARECDVVMTCLPTSKEVRAVLFGDDGLAKNLQRGSLIVDMTTGNPNDTREMAATLKAQGIDLIDAPVSGGPHGAVAGTIAILVGAPPALFERIRPVLSTISPNVFHIGDVGSGHLMKLVNNVISAGLRVLTFEAVAMGVKNGLDLKTCVEVLHKASARSYITETSLPKLLDPNRTQTFSLELMLKDVRLATEIGVASGAPMPAAGLVRELYQLSLNEHGGAADVNDMIHTFERMANVKVTP